MKDFIKGLQLLQSINNDFDLWTGNKGYIIICGIEPHELSYIQSKKLKSLGFGIDSTNIYYYC
jgi:hypothetical protein